MKTIRLLLTLGAPILAIWAVGSKIRSEKIDDVSSEATFVKIIFRPLIKKAASRSLRGRYIDRQELTRGRFTPRDVDRILEATWRHFDELAPLIHKQRLTTHGNRLLVLLGAATLALYRALLFDGIEKGYATELTTDVLWACMETSLPMYRSVARLAHRDPEKQMHLMLRMLLRFPFSPPGYKTNFYPKEGASVLDIYHCPVYEYFKELGEEDVLLNSWCKVDFALAQVMTEGGFYERPHTLAAGDPFCDQRFYGRPKTQPEVSH